MERDERDMKGGKHGNKDDMPTNSHAVSEVNLIVNALVRCGVAMISMIVVCWASSINTQRIAHMCVFVYAAVSCPIHVRNTFTMSSVHFVYLLIFDVITSVISFSALRNANYIRCGDTEYTIHSTHTHPQDLLWLIRVFIVCSV